MFVYADKSVDDHNYFTYSAPSLTNPPVSGSAMEINHFQAAGLVSYSKMKCAQYSSEVS